MYLVVKTLFTAHSLPYYQRLDLSRPAGIDRPPTYTYPAQLHSLAGGSDVDVGMNGSIRKALA